MLKYASWCIAEPNEVLKVIRQVLYVKQNVHHNQSETHIADEPGEMFYVDGYNFINKPRSKGKGGAVGFYIYSSINWKVKILNRSGSKLSRRKQRVFYDARSTPG